jgi:hypothetical protein
LRPRGESTLDRSATCCQCERTEAKETRLQIRIDSAAKRRLEQAADAIYLTLSSFVLQAAEQRAERVLARRRVVHMTQGPVEAPPGTFEGGESVGTSHARGLHRSAKKAKKKERKKKH